MRRRPEPLPALAPRYLESRSLAGMTPKELRTEQTRLLLFLSWCEGQGIELPEEVTPACLEGYQRSVMARTSLRSRGKPLAVRTRRDHLSVMRGFFRWVVREGHLVYDPAADLELPGMPRKLPPVLTEREVERLLCQPDLKTPEGLRDRAILEVLYSTAMRRGELLGLTAYDVDMAHGTVLIRQGKGRKDRVVPIGERALHFIERYVREARGLLPGAEDEALFPMPKPYRSYLSTLVRGYIERARLDKRGACHLLRHTAATLMLEHGADTRYIQEMLGHARLGTTQIYTHVTIGKLKEIHTATHPGARLAPDAS